MPIYEPGTPSPDPTWKIILLYGDLGARKTSLFFTAKNGILIDANSGSKRAYNSINKKRFIIEKGWNELEYAARSGDLNPYDVIGLDTAKDLQEYLSKAIMQDSPGLRDKDGSLSRNGYTVLYDRFHEDLLAHIANKVLIVIAHSDFDGDDVKRAIPLLSGKIGQFIGSQAELIGYVHKIEDKIVIDFANSGKYVSKGREWLTQLEVPHYSDPTWPTFIQTELLDKMDWENEITPTVTTTISSGLAPSHTKSEPAPVLSQTKSEPEWRAAPAPKAEPMASPEDIAKWTDTLQKVASHESMNEAVFEIKQAKLGKPFEVYMRSIIKEKIKALNLTLNKATNLYETKPDPVAAEEPA